MVVRTDETDVPTMVLYGRLAHALRMRFGERLATQPWVAESGMRRPVYGILRVINAREPVSQKDVSEAVGLHPSDMVSLVDLLESNGWAIRERSAGDRRRYDLRLTSDGRATLGRLDALAADAEEAFLGALSPPERATLRRLLGKVLQANDAAAE